jgi:hypothetical protein
MSLWKYLFDTEWRQREDIELLRASSGTSQTDAQKSAKKLDHLQRRVDRAELLLESLYRLVSEKNLVTADEFRLMVARVDLEDGIEDGRIGPDRNRRAPKCPECKRAVNRKRTHCVFCGAEVKPRKPSTGAPYR